MPGTIVIQIMIEFNYRVNWPLKPRISWGPAMTDRVFREMTRSAYVAKGVNGACSQSGSLSSKHIRKCSQMYVEINVPICSCEITD